MWKRIWLFALALSALAPRVAQAHPGHDHGGLAGGSLHHLLAPIAGLLVIGVAAALFARSRAQRVTTALGRTLSRYQP